jgi:hypothetical protein
MNRNRLAMIVSGALLLTSSAAATAAAQKEIEACSLLTVADASKALEQASRPGKRMVEASPTGCIWSADPAASDSSRRIGLNTHTPRAFGFAKSPAITTIKIEPVTGLGDEAFYQIYPNDQSPFIWVRKGSTAISIRILGTKTNRFGLEQEKAKELTLAKAAIAKL